MTVALDARLRGYGVRLTHSVSTSLLPDPYAIGRHEPDVIGYIADWRYVGEAKRGPELFEEHTQEQLRDFSRRHTPGWKRSTFFLYVPSAYADDTRHAVIAAGGDMKNTTIITPKRVRIRRKVAASATKPQLSAGTGGAAAARGGLAQAMRRRLAQ